MGVDGDADPNPGTDKEKFRSIRQAGIIPC